MLALNAAHAAVTAPLDGAGLERLLAQAHLALGRRDGRAYVIAIHGAADHDGTNFRWLAARQERMLYVDRVLVATDLQGRGIGRALYEVVIAAAEAEGLAVTCEVSLRPPNPGSMAFHEALGFAAIGRGTPAPGKEVCYLMRQAAALG